jgi:hypothetical protein
LDRTVTIIGACCAGRWALFHLRQQVTAIRSYVQKHEYLSSRPRYDTHMLEHGKQHCSLQPGRQCVVERSSDKTGLCACQNTDHEPKAPGLSNAKTPHDLHQPQTAKLWLSTCWQAMYALRSCAANTRNCSHYDIPTYPSCNPQSVLQSVQLLPVMLTHSCCTQLTAQPPTSNPVQTPPTSPQSNSKNKATMLCWVCCAGEHACLACGAQLL